MDLFMFTEKNHSMLIIHLNRKKALAYVEHLYNDDFDWNELFTDRVEALIQDVQ